MFTHRGFPALHSCPARHWRAWGGEAAEQELTIGKRACHLLQAVLRYDFTCSAMSGGFLSGIGNYVECTVQSMAKDRPRRTDRPFCWLCLSHREQIGRALYFFENIYFSSQQLLGCWIWGFVDDFYSKWV